jgi:hypothetical protein
VYNSVPGTWVYPNRISRNPGARVLGIPGPEDKSVTPCGLQACHTNGHECETTAKLQLASLRGSATLPGPWFTRHLGMHTLGAQSHSDVVSLTRLY